MGDDVSFWVLVQILLNLVLIGAVGVVWVRLSRPAKDDPRLSKGLQLLQSKISVLEDLSDRTETQVSQLTAIIEGKCREIQEKIAAADKQISRIDASAQKSLEVARIFQDRIPHSEILERQNTIKYVTAARLAHQGHPVEEIARHVDLSRAELEFIAKVNREKLQFSEEDLPDWARVPASAEAAPNAGAGAGASEDAVRFSLPRENFQAPPVASAAPAPAAAPNPAAAPAYATGPYAGSVTVNANGIAGNGQTFLEIDLRAPESAPAAPQAAAAAPAKSGAPAKSAAPAARPATIRAQTSDGKTVEVRPVSFPRIRTDRDA